MIDAMSCIRLERGAPLFSEGDVGKTAYLIQSGAIDIFVQRKAGTALLGRRGPGDIIGEMALISDAPRSASARVAMDCELVPVTAEQIAHHFATLDPIARMCLSALAERLRETIPPADPNHTGPRSALLAPMSLSDFDAAVASLTLERQIEDALARHEFELYLQPIVEMANGSLRGLRSLDPLEPSDARHCAARPLHPGRRGQWHRDPHHRMVPRGGVPHLPSAGGCGDGGGTRQIARGSVGRCSSASIFPGAIWRERTLPASSSACWRTRACRPMD